MDRKRRCEAVRLRDCNGSVTVTGKISGNGALVATKNITVTGSMNASADLAALVAGGDISITGQGATTSSFQGLILAEGSFKAKDTTLIGSALTLDKNGSVQLERVRTVAARDLTKVDLNYAKELKDAFKSNAGIDIQLRYQGVPIPFELENIAKIESIGIDAFKTGIPVEFGVIQGSKFITPSDPEYANLRAQTVANLNDVQIHWKNFENQVASNSIQYENVFQLDFNKFLKTKGGLRPLLQRISAL